jgi:hypothetical protein
MYDGTEHCCCAGFSVSFVDILCAPFYSGNGPAARPLPTQDNTNRKRPKTYIRVASWFLTHNSSIGAVDISTDRAVTVVDNKSQ